ncbi:DUF3576 domain-containing protein [Candidatus Bandiella woodruffii]|uniref:DUF3576 domain-containing protein n=2 Tax=Candidatus Bandiella euplotis TaxID=1664265 RepID=A0ABZ0UNH9_9RICK|nr:DUF3576 domain-containing protein [Candidatus Bandiella woodruffii]
MTYLRYTVCLAAICMLSSCSKLDVQKSYPKTKQQIEEQRVGTLSSGGIFLFGGKDEGLNTNKAVNVNGYLWKSALDKVNFMPINSCDSFGGVIVTDWYSTGENSKERYKINIFINGKEFKADSLKVNVYKQRLDNRGNWGNQFSDHVLANQIAEQIINGARELRFLEKKYN